MLTREQLRIGLRWAPSVGVLAGVAGLLTASLGCQVTKRLTSDPLVVNDNDAEVTSTTLEPEDFVAVQASTTRNADGTAGDANPPAAGVAADIGFGNEDEAIAAGSADDDVSLNVIPPLRRLEYGGSAQPGIQVTVGGMVGQVNGRPIYVDAVFAPIADELAMEGRRMGYEDFARFALAKISQRLTRMVEIELLLAEAVGQLTPPQQEGLLHLLGNIEDGLIRGAGGSAKETDRQLLAEKGITLDEQLAQYRDDILIEEVMREIRARITVSWRDIERYYRDHPSEFNPPSAIQLRIIVIAKDNLTKQQELIEALEAGHPFELAAEDYSDLMASQGGLMTPIALTKGREGAELTIWPQVNKAAETLEVGVPAGPFVEEIHAVWFQIERYDDGAPVPLRDAQKAIEMRLRAQYENAEFQKYFEKLRARGNFDDLEMMATSLLAVALDRWAPVE